VEVVQQLRVRGCGWDERLGLGLLCAGRRLGGVRGGEQRKLAWWSAAGRGAACPPGLAGREAGERGGARAVDACSEGDWAMEVRALTRSGSGRT
jgi:hypothetical protein